MSDPRDEETGAVVPWERRSGESGPAFEAFTIYRDLGEDRSTSAVASELAKSGSLIRRWSSEWDWVERVREYDARLDQAKLMATIETTGQMAERHARYAARVQEALMRPVEEFLARLDPDHEKAIDFDEMGTAEMLRMVELAARCLAQVGQFERLARGLSLGGGDDDQVPMDREGMARFLTGVGPDGADAVLEDGITA